MSERLLAVVTEPQLEAVTDRLAKRLQIEITKVESVSAALQQLSAAGHDYLLASAPSLGEGALPLLRRLTRMTPLTDLFIVTAGGEPLEVPLDLRLEQSQAVADIVTRVVAAIEQRRLLRTAGIYGHSDNLREVARRIAQVAPTEITVLVTGPSGTGKELVASAIHDNSRRSQKEFVSINCASIPETLLESELFGHERGAFTGADRKREGLFVAADGGSLFLDEIGELHSGLQAKLLRVLDNGTFIPLGANKPVRVDVRIIAATNRDLQQLVEDREFRADLYYRLGVINIGLQRLAERPEDILPIVAHYLDQLKTNLSFSPSATDLLLSYGWPGNVRELTNFLQRLLVTKPTGEVDREQVLALLDEHRAADRTLPVVTNIRPEESGFRLVYQALLNLANEVGELKQLIRDRLPEENLSSPGGSVTVATVADGEMALMEDQWIRDALRRYGGNRKEAAAALGIGERTLYRKLKKYSID